MNTFEAWLPYLIEIRKRLLRVVLLYTLIFAALYPFANTFYQFFSHPLQRILPDNSHIVATTLTSTFTVPLKLILLLAFYFCIPYLFHQAWAFVSPALYPHEKKHLFWPIFCGILLFFIGSFFCYFLVLPMTLNFFTTIAPPDVMLMTDMGHYLDFVIQMILAFGFAFQIPLILNLLIRFQIIHKKTCRTYRPYVIVFAFILGMILTPPDVISQVMLALPLWGLFELGLLFAPTYE